MATGNEPVKSNSKGRPVVVGGVVAFVVVAVIVILAVVPLKTAAEEVSVAYIDEETYIEPGQQTLFNNVQRSLRGGICCLTSEY